MKIWAITKKNNKIVLDMIVENSAIEIDGISKLIAIVCEEFDIGKPLILSKNMMELSEFGRTVFYPADFIESIDFDTFEVEIVEDKPKDK